MGKYDRYFKPGEATQYSEATKAAAGKYADCTLMGDECWLDNHPDYARQLWLEAMNHLDEFYRTQGVEP